jgi:sugar lactone lactonase YvrE
MYVGDRSGTVHRVREFGDREPFAVLEPSVSAFHLAFGLDGRLYVTAPGLASFDAVQVVDRDGYDEKYVRGFGRPQGFAFDRDGNLYVAASLKQRRGIVRISPNGKKAELFVAGMNIVGLCFGSEGEMFVATNETVYRLPLRIYGTLLD